jgi:hypothetical protein
MFPLVLSVFDSMLPQIEHGTVVTGRLINFEYRPGALRAVFTLP